MKVLIDIPKEEYKHILQQDVFNTYEQGIIQDGKVLEEATNGDMIKAIFPNIDVSVSGDGDVIDVYNLGIYCPSFDTDWWNAPYEEESEDKE